MPTFQVVVTNVAENKLIYLIKALRIIGNLGLRDANVLAHLVAARKTCVLASGLSRDVADHFVALLRDAGTTAKLEESTNALPYMLSPHVNKRYKWNWLGRVALD